MVCFTGFVVNDDRAARRGDSLVGDERNNDNVMKAGVALLACAAAAIAFVNVALPYGGDQALFTLGARHILAGDMLYRDFWDLKQPGIFWFFAAARIIFGPGPTAVHLLETIWFLSFTFALFTAARRWFDTPPMRVLLPVAGGVYAELVLTAQSATQVESLAALPLFVSLWLFVEAIRGTPRTNLLLFGAGVAAGVAICLKLLFVITIVPMWLFAAAFSVRRDTLHVIAWRSAAATIALGMGLAVPLGATLAFFLTHGALNDALTTWFIAPTEIVHELPHQRVAVLVASARGYLTAFLPIIALAAVGLFSLRRRDFLAWGSIGWLAGGLVTILVQSTSWWPYQWFFLAPPTGVIASYGLQRILRDRVARTPALAPICLVLLLAYPAAYSHTKLFAFARHGFAIRNVDREAFRESVEPAIVRSRITANELHTTARDIYIFGDPLLYEALGTLQPIAINGWLPELLTRRTRHELLVEMRNAPPYAIYVEDSRRNKDVARLLRRSPDFERFLMTKYRGRELRFGTLYERNDSVRSPLRRTPLKPYRGTIDGPKAGRISGATSVPRD